MAAAKAIAAATVGLGDATVSEGELLRQIENLKIYAQSHKGDLPNRIYEAMDGISRTALAYLHKDKSKGWATGALNAAGESIWTPEQAAVLEEAAPAAIAVQAGGALNPLTFTADSKLVTPGGDAPPISLDAAYKQVQSYLASIDAKNREIAATIGPVAFINGMDTDPSIGPLPPYLPVPIKIPARTILPMVNAFLESMRLLVSSRFIDSSFLRSFYSILLGVFDVFRGNWRDGVLSLLGVIGYTPMIIGMVLKTVRFVYSWISPDIQGRLEDDMFAATKSLFVGGWLWLFSTVSPDYIREMITTMIEKAKMPLEELNKKIGDIEAKAQEAAKEAGVQVVFPKVPLEKIPSFNDIQNFQSLLSNPQIYCSAQFQGVLASAISIPPLRLFFELLNIPTVPEDIQERCKDMPKDIGAAVAESMKPIVIPLPAPEKQEQENKPSSVAEQALQEQPKQGGRKKTRRNRRKH